jgi:hypothetical protein
MFRGPISLVATNEELLERESSGSGLENTYMHLTIPIETAPTILYTLIHATHYRTTWLPVLEILRGYTRHQTTILYLTIYSLILHLCFYLVYLHVFCFVFASDMFILASLTAAIAKF